MVLSAGCRVRFSGSISSLHTFIFHPKQDTKQQRPQIYALCAVQLKLVRSRFCILSSNQCKQPNPQITMPFRPSHFGFHLFPYLWVTILYFYDDFTSSIREQNARVFEQRLNTFLIVSSAFKMKLNEGRNG